MYMDPEESQTLSLQMCLSLILLILSFWSSVGCRQPLYLIFLDFYFYLSVPISVLFCSSCIAEQFL